MEIGRIDEASALPLNCGNFARMLNDGTKQNPSLLHLPQLRLPSWADQGQLHKMLPLRAVESRVSDQNNAGDEGDEREVKSMKPTPILKLIRLGRPGDG